VRAPAFISQRWKSATGSLLRPGWLRPPDWPLPLDEPALRDESVLLDQLSLRGAPSLRGLPPGPPGGLLLALGWLFSGWLLLSGWPPGELSLPGWSSPRDSDT